MRVFQTIGTGIILLQTLSVPLLFVFLWSTGFIGARLGMPHADPGIFLSIRFALAFLILTLICFLMRAKWPKPSDAIHSIIIGIFVHGLYLGPIFWSIDRGLPAGISAIIVGLQPLLTAFLAGWWLGERITKTHWTGIGLGILGVSLVIAPGLPDASSGITITNVVASFLAVSSMTFGTVYQKRITASIDLRTGTTLQYLGGFLPVAPLALFFESRVFDINGESVFAMAWLVFALSIAAVFLLMWLIRQGSISSVSSLFFMVPVTTSLMAYFLFDEKLSAPQLLGMGLCAMAVALASRQNASKTESQ